MISDHECGTFVIFLSNFCCFLYSLGDIITSFVAISEVVLVVSDVILDNFLKVGKQFAKHILQNGLG